jgi:hypothetical protein
MIQLAQEPATSARSLIERISRRARKADDFWHLKNSYDEQQYDMASCEHLRKHL